MFKGCVPRQRRERTTRIPSKRSWLPVWFVGLAFLMTACPSTYLRSTQHASNFHAAQIHRVLVIGLSQNQAIRKAFETEFVRQWNQHGVQAISSLAVLPATTTLDKFGVAPIARTQGFDAVLVSRVLSRNIVHPGTPEVSSNTITEGDAQNLNSTLQVLMGPPIHTAKSQKVSVETDLYDVASEQRVWTATTHTDVVGDPAHEMEPFVELILKTLYRTP